MVKRKKTPISDLPIMENSIKKLHFAEFICFTFQNFIHVLPSQVPVFAVPGVLNDYAGRAFLSGCVFLE